MRPFGSVGEAPPDLMILDLNLPALDGTEVCRLLRARPATASLPIIMLTARTGESDRVSGLDLGRRRLRHEAVQPARTRGARAGRAAPTSQAASRAAMSLYRGKHLAADFDAVSVTVDGDPSG